MFEKALRMRDTAFTGRVWLQRICNALFCVKERSVRAFNQVGHVIVQLTAQDYHVKVKVH